MLKAKLFNLRLDHARRQRNESEQIEFDVKSEVQKLLSVLKNLRIADGEIDKDQLMKSLEDNHFPIEVIEKDFDFDKLIKLLEEESNKGDDDNDDFESDLRIMVSDDTQTDILGLQMEEKDVQVQPEVIRMEIQTIVSMADKGVNQSVMVKPSTNESGNLFKPTTKDSNVRNYKIFFKYNF